MSIPFNPATGLPAEMLYFGPKYLWTIAELEEHAAAKLGSMDAATYEQYVDRMMAIAQAAGIINPILTLGVKFKPSAHHLVAEQPYAVTNGREWSVMKSDAEDMCEYMPNVFVVDGSKFVVLN